VTCHVGFRHVDERADPSINCKHFDEKVSSGLLRKEHQTAQVAYGAMTAADRVDF
jgi:hypothetical protein